MPRHVWRKVWRVVLQTNWKELPPVIGPLGVTARNVNHALPLAVQLFKEERNVRRIAPRDPAKVTLELRQPFCTVTANPLERVLFYPQRDANPFFHLLEALWILDGRDDVKWLAGVLPKMAEYSDDGVVFHGAYGARARRVAAEPGVIDQLGCVIKQLKHDPDTRRAVVALYQPELDAGYSGKDMPCNCTLTYKLREGKLNCTVFNRSNDMVWGAYGANVVQFSIMQEYVAAMVGCEVGTLYQWSDSFHVYEKEASWRKVSTLQYGNKVDPYDYAPTMYGRALGRSAVVDEYTSPVRPWQLVRKPESFDIELTHFLNRAGSSRECNIVCGYSGYDNVFLDRVAVPMVNACMAHQNGEKQNALQWVAQIGATDWQLAAHLWLDRRYEEQYAAT